MTARKSRDKARSAKQPPAGFDQKRAESSRISEQIARFQSDGGLIEKLGTTRVLQKIDPVGPAASAPAGIGKPARR